MVEKGRDAFQGRRLGRVQNPFRICYCVWGDVEVGSLRYFRVRGGEARDEVDARLLTFRMR